MSYAPGAEQAGPAQRPTTVPMSQGQPARTYQDVVVLGWNDLGAAQRVFAEQGGRIAGGADRADRLQLRGDRAGSGFPPGLRALCDRHGALLIFDEVQTGVRISLGGAQAVLGVTPDITCMGKAVSGGFPVSAIGGRRDLMELIADRRVFQSGTYNTNPLCLAAIPVVLDRLAEPGTHAEMERLSRRLRAGIAQLIGPLGGYVQGTSTMFGIGFGPGPLSHDARRLGEQPEKIMRAEARAAEHRRLHQADPAGYLVRVHRAHRGRYRRTLEGGRGGRCPRRRAWTGPAKQLAKKIAVGRYHPYTQACRLPLRNQLLGERGWWTQTSAPAISPDAQLLFDRQRHITRRLKTRRGEYGRFSARSGTSAPERRTL